MQMKNAKWTSNWNESEKEINLQGKRPDTTKQYCFEFQVTLLTSCSICQKIFKTKNHEQTPETKHYFFLKQSPCCSWFLTVWQCGISILQAFTVVFHLHPSAPPAPPPPNKRHLWLGQLPTSSPTFSHLSYKRSNGSVVDGEECLQSVKKHSLRSEMCKYRFLDSSLFTCSILHL